MRRADPCDYSGGRPRWACAPAFPNSMRALLFGLAAATLFGNGNSALAQDSAPAATCCTGSAAGADKPFWPNLFDTSDFPQRWFCGHWTPLLGWMHIISDLAIWGAYTAIPVVLCFFIRRRRDMPFPMIFWLFSVFILACGTGHFIEATIFWHPWYRLSALVKIGTACVSWLTVLALIPVLPKALALPGLAKINQDLQTEIIERKRAEAALCSAKESLERKNVRLAELYNTAHQFVDHVSHEFRTPLTVVKEFSSIIRDGLAGDVNPEQKEYLDIVMSRVDDLAFMVEDMLDISKLEAGVFGVCRQDTRVEEIVEHIRPTLERKFATMKVSLDIAIEESMPCVFCDPEKIGRVLINLAINALKFSREGGRVKLWCRHDLGQPEVLMGVTDNGPGIAPANLQLIFERFKQLESDPRASTKGFGLGLNIARELVLLNFGEIWVESVLGKGSTFSFSIPTSDRMPLIRRYIQRIEQFSRGAAAVSLARAEIQPTSDRMRLDDVEKFLQHQLRCNDLLFRTERHDWVIVAPAEGHAMNPLIERIEKAHAESNRNRMGGPIPRIAFHREGTWRIRRQREEFLASFESALGMKEAIHA